jgi:hypothetical protein
MRNSIKIKMTWKIMKSHFMYRTKTLVFTHMFLVATRGHCPYCESVLVLPGLAGSVL